MIIACIEPPAFYGKLPGHGDFVGRGLSNAQQEAIDGWLAAWLASARDAWGEDFEGRYRDAQPWLFGGERVAAVAIPSADRVGRLFPLLAAARAGVALQDIYDAVVSAIGEGWTGDRLLDALGGLAADEPKAPQGWFVPDDEAPAMPQPLMQPGGETIGAMLA